jgi:hypothetical protein
MTRLSAAMAAVSLAVVGATTACGGSSTPAAGPPPTRQTTSVSPCPTPTGGRTAAWPATVPRDLPRPPHLAIVSSQTTKEGIHLVRFTTPTSLRESVLFVVQKLPAAGYVLGRGDAELSEADAPFVHGSVRGLLKMLATQPCRTDWLLATVKATRQSTTSPLLTPHPSASPSPLPFH